MAAIDDLISQVEDEALRNRLRSEARRLTKEKKFGLVFEEHLPELTPIYAASIRRGSQVAIKGQALENVWRVLSVDSEIAECINPANGRRQKLHITDLIVVKRFGEPIFPSLKSIAKVQNGSDDIPWHTLIESDNYHALQLLEYLYPAKVDCIYIDPPYNTGARDWKYNNNYVDSNDRWRHSKWLAMMHRRLLLSKRLLKRDTGVLIVTIDEHEVHHLGMLLEQVFPECTRQMVSIVINQKGVAQGRLARVEEYAIFVFMPGALLQTYHDDLLSPDRTDEKRLSNPRWERLLRGGNNSRREDRPGLFYPIYIDPERKSIIEVGEVLPLEEQPDLNKATDGSVAWPIRTDGSLGNWQLQPSTFRELLKLGYVRLGGFHKNRNTWTVLYLNRGTRSRIDSGHIIITGRNSVTGSVEIEYASPESRQRNIKTVWHRGVHDSGIYGSSILRNILGGEVNFSFPKSIYSVRDAIGAVVRDRPSALIVDFFAGSGTTLHAVDMLNESDGGHRQCILVTNNEVSEEEARTLSRQGYSPGDPEWELNGICRSVTWPRCKYTIQGKRDDGTEVDGDYLTGKMISRTRSRTYRRLGFIDNNSLTTAARKKEIVAMIDGIPMSAIKLDTVYFASEDEQYTSAILFDDSQADNFLSALQGLSHITHVYIVTDSNKVFQTLKAQIDDILGPVEIQEEERRPMKEGFQSNLEYFKIDFLEKDRVTLGHQLREILPLLWLQAGATGPRPILPSDSSIPALLAPIHNSFIVLVDETQFSDLLKVVDQREDVTHVFLVTDSEEGFREMAAQIKAPNIVQLYRDYLENFAINRGERV